MMSFLFILARLCLGSDYCGLCLLDFTGDEAVNVCAQNHRFHHECIVRYRNSRYSKHPDSCPRENCKNIMTREILERCPIQKVEEVCLKRYRETHSSPSEPEISYQNESDDAVTFSYSDVLNAFEREASWQSGFTIGTKKPTRRRGFRCTIS
jgi:hypothetical protein